MNKAVLLITPNHVTLSDEIIIELSEHNQDFFSTKKTAHHPENNLPTVKHGVGSIMLRSSAQDIPSQFDRSEVRLGVFSPEELPNQDLLSWQTLTQKH